MAYHFLPHPLPQLLVFGVVHMAMHRGAKHNSLSTDLKRYSLERDELFPPRRLKGQAWLWVSASGGCCAARLGQMLVIGALFLT